MAKSSVNMTLIKSISGIRGTIGGRTGDNLTPIDVVRFTASFCAMMQQRQSRKDIRVVIGRDARISGPMVSSLVSNTLIGMGAYVIDLGLSTTPSVELAVPHYSAHAGIILTASHNPGQWNALKLLNHLGEFISAEEGAEMLAVLDSGEIEFALIDQLGDTIVEDFLEQHLAKILALPLVNKTSIARAGLRIGVDAVNSSGGIYVPALLKALGVSEVHELYCTPNGHFPHNPEPLPEHLQDLSQLVRNKGLDLGIVVDPDVDRLAFVCEDGSMFGEEYTLVAVADYVLKHTPGNTVSNLSSTRALRDITIRHGQRYEAAAVGEVNVVAKMKEINAVIGGEGNGGIIYPESHYGRDALVGIALFLSHFVNEAKKASELRDSYPAYAMSKNKIELKPGTDVDAILEKIKGLFGDATVNTIDGVKLDFPNEWVHLRKSNTEPIIRIYAESPTRIAAEQLAHRVMNKISELV